MSYADNYTDEMLAELERKITQVYYEAQKDLERTAKEYFAKFEKRDVEYKKLIDSGKITEKEYKQWRLNQIGRGERFNKMAADMAERATKANEVAVAYVNDATPSIYSLNRNHEAYVIEKLGYDMSANGDFTLYNEATVRRLIVTAPDVMPYYPPARAVRRGIDLEYGQKYIKKHVTSGILQGKSVYKIADDLQRDLTNMNRASAVRTARTAVTSAQNGGRQDSMNAAAKMGIKLRKRWVSAKDTRVRDAHGAADGQTVDVDKPFNVGGEKMMFPGDRTSASGWNLYNCRCGMRTVEKEGIEAEKRQIRVRNPETGRNELVEEMTYKKWANLRSTKTVSGNKKLTSSAGDGKIISGGISGARNPYSDEAKEHAQKYYGLVRSMKTDVAQISKVTGLSEKDVQSIKDFIFNEKHDLGNGKLEYFEPDYMMAESWQRLISGKPEKHDITLLKHELMEKELIAKGVSQERAHLETSKKYNYSKEASEYYAEIKKHKSK